MQNSLARRAHIEDHTLCGLIILQRAARLVVKNDDAHAVGVAAPVAHARNHGTHLAPVGPVGHQAAVLDRHAAHGASIACVSLRSVDSSLVEGYTQGLMDDRPDEHALAIAKQVVKDDADVIDALVTRAVDGEYIDPDTKVFTRPGAILEATESDVVEGEYTRVGELSTDADPNLNDIGYLRACYRRTKGIFESAASQLYAGQNLIFNTTRRDIARHILGDKI